MRLPLRCVFGPARVSKKPQQSELQKTTNVARILKFYTFPFAIQNARLLCFLNYRHHHQNNNITKQSRFVEAAATAAVLERKIERHPPRQNDDGSGIRLNGNKIFLECDLPFRLLCFVTDFGRSQGPARDTLSCVVLKPSSPLHYKSISHLTCAFKLYIPSRA